MAGTMTQSKKLYDELMSRSEETKRKSEDNFCKLIIPDLKPQSVASVQPYSLGYYEGMMKYTYDNERYELDELKDDDNLVVLAGTIFDAKYKYGYLDSILLGYPYILNGTKEDQDLLVPLEDNHLWLKLSNMKPIKKTLGYDIKKDLDELQLSEIYMNRKHYIGIGYDILIVGKVIKYNARYNGKIKYGLRWWSFLSSNFSTYLIKGKKLQMVELPRIYSKPFFSIENDQYKNIPEKQFESDKTYWRRSRWYIQSYSGYGRKGGA